MIKKELIESIKTCKRVYASTRLTDDDMANVQVLKVDLIWHVKRSNTNKFNAFITDNGDLLIG